MIGQDFDRIRRRYHEYWNRENHDRPLIRAYGERSGAVWPTWPEGTSLRDRWMDTEKVVRFKRRQLECTAFVGEAYPLLNPDFGPDFLGAVMGCDIGFGETTSWAHPFVEDWSTLPDLRFDPQNPWWRAMAEMTEAAMADSKGDYLVGVADLHPGLDGLVSLRGPERLCMDLFDVPEEILRRTWQVHEVFRGVLDAQLALTAPRQGGTSNWMGLFHPGRQYVTSCDAACLISTEDFETFVVPELVAELEYLDASVYHLDGPGSLRHLDRLLSLGNLDGIQWVPGAGQKPMREWIPVLRRIQDAGKLLQLSIEPEDLLPLCEALRPEGVELACWFSDAEEAADAVRAAEQASRGRRRTMD